jgi:protein-disulfide isomerase
MTKEVKVMAGIAVVIIGLGALLFINDKPASERLKQSLNNDGAYVLGNPDAKVEIVEFADLQCPACAASVDPLHRILLQNPDEVKLVFRHFPLPQHGNAYLAAQAIEAAGEQDRFWEMYDTLYARQAEWSGSTLALDNFITYAASLGLNTDEFRTAVTSGKFIDKIEADIAAARALGVNSTPTFFVNGIRSVGVPNAQFEALVSSELTKEN